MDQHEFEVAVHANIELFDDGKHNDGNFDDGDFSNVWYSKEFPQALYLNLRITDINSEKYMFERCAEKFTLVKENLMVSSVNIFDNHINFDGKINPGENVRLNFEVKNNSGFDFDMANIFIYPKGDVISSQNRHFFFNDLAAGEIDSTEYIHGDETSYYEFQAENDTTRIYFDAIIHDDKNHQWSHENWFSLNVVPFELDHDIIIPNKISGKSKAMFKIRIIDTAVLKNHQYLIAVSDSISPFNEKMFHLIDQTINDTLLENQTPPEQFGYNLPVTDGFKVIEAFLPHGGFEGTCQESPNGHPCAFEDVDENGRIKKSGHIFTRIKGDDFPKLIELEFVNEIDSNGVVGNPNGQSAFRMISFPNDGPDGFFPCPFNVWQLENSQRVSLLNAGFLENEYRAVPDSQWQPGELIYIFKTPYDETGQIYLNQPLVWEDLIVEVFLSFKSGQSIVDSGDQIYLEYKYPATSEDQFLFVPTHTKVIGTDVKTKKYEIFQNYPNPFNPSTNIHFSIEKTGFVSLKIYNIRGQLVEQLFDKKFFPGSYSVHWNGTDRFGQPVSSGLYFAGLSTDQKASIIKMLLIR